MTPSRPYLLRSLYEWILDNDATPHLLVNALHPQAHVPQDYVENGQIILNVAPSAVKSLSLGNEYITFSARFRGIPMDVSVPMEAVLGIYAKENGQGMMFEEGGPDLPTPPASPSGTSPSGAGPVPSSGGSSKRPSLRVVK